jgi:hypothetical protein
VGLGGQRTSARKKFRIRLLAQCLEAAKINPTPLQILLDHIAQLSVLAGILRILSYTDYM